MSGLALLRNVDVRLLRADGVFRWHTLHLQATRDEAGEIADTVGVAIDIHDTRHAWELYEASERRLQASFQGACMGAWEWDMKTRVVRMTEQLAKIYAFPAGTGTVTLDELTERVAPEYREAYQRQLDAVLRQRAPFEMDFLLDERVVPRRWLRMRGHPEHDQEGVLARVYGVTFDISEQREHEERLSLSERRYRALVESTGAMVWSADPDGGIRPARGPWGVFSGPIFACCRLGMARSGASGRSRADSSQVAGCAAPENRAVADVPHTPEGRRLSPRAGECGTSLRPVRQSSGMVRHDRRRHGRSTRPRPRSKRATCGSRWRCRPPS